MIDVYLKDSFAFKFTRENINTRIFITDKLERGLLIQIGWLCMEVTRNEW